MKHKVIIKAEGNNASGKSYVLTKIMDSLKRDGFKVEEDSLRNKHEIAIVNEY